MRVGSQVADPLFPDPETQSLIESQQPKLPLTCVRDHLEIPPGWNLIPRDRWPSGTLMPMTNAAPRSALGASKSVTDSTRTGLMDPDRVAAAIAAFARP
jgi:hypothetical protein